MFIQVYAHHASSSILHGNPQGDDAFITPNIHASLLGKPMTLEQGHSRVFIKCLAYSISIVSMVIAMDVDTHAIRANWSNI